MMLVSVKGINKVKLKVKRSDMTKVIPPVSVKVALKA
jgi:hypothetical protein